MFPEFRFHRSLLFRRGSVVSGIPSSFCHIVSCFIDIICRYFFLLVRHLADRNRSVAHLVRMAADSFYRSHQPAFFPAGHSGRRSCQASLTPGCRSCLRYGRRIAASDSVQWILLCSRFLFARYFRALWRFPRYSYDRNCPRSALYLLGDIHTVFVFGFLTDCHQNTVLFL